MKMPRLVCRNYMWNWIPPINKTNLRDLIAATGLVILVQLDSNRRFFALVTLKFDGWPRKIIRHISYTTSSFVYHFISISKFKLELESGNAQSFIPWLCVFYPRSSGWLTMLPYVIRMRQLILSLSHPYDLDIPSISSGWFMTDA